MIEFSGYLTGGAEKWYFIRSIAPLQYIALASVVIGLVNYPSLVRMAHIWPPIAVFLILFYAVCLLSPPWLRTPLLKKEKLVKTPFRISIEEDYIVCVAGKHEAGREVSDVKAVRDHGDFYELVFPFGKGDQHFICQKYLLTKGSPEAFEALFADIIVPVR